MRSVAYDGHTITWSFDYDVFVSKFTDNIFCTVSDCCCSCKLFIVMICYSVGRI